MKKYIVLTAILMVFVLSIGANAYTLKEEDSKNIESIYADDFTHTVLIEFAGTSKCGYCPTAHIQLDSIYNQGNYDFMYVSMIVDENYETYDRIKELGVTGVPDVFMDGGYRNVKGAQEDEQPYINAIEASGQREVPDLSIDVNVEWKAQAIIKIIVTVTNNEENDYNGLLRVYIVEPESRYEDVRGNMVHFGVLDIPVIKPLSVSNAYTKPLGETYTFTHTWFGALHGFNDITKENLIVVASVFDTESGDAVETGVGSPTTRSNTEIKQTDTHINLFNLPIFTRIMEVIRDIIFK